MSQCFPGKAAKRPSFSQHRGATWDSLTVILPDGTEIDGHLDTSWGAWVYFEIAGKWRRVPVTWIKNWQVDLRASPAWTGGPAGGKGANMQELPTSSLVYGFTHARAHAKAPKPNVSTDGAPKGHREEATP